MISIFYKQLSWKLTNKTARCYNQFLPSGLRWAEFRVFKTVLRCIHSNVSSHKLDEVAQPEHRYIRSVLRSKKEYHYALFDLQLEEHPEKFKILDNELLNELQDWVFAAQTASRCEDKTESNELVLNGRLPLVEKMERCNLSDCFKVLAFFLNVSRECLGENLIHLYSVISRTIIKEIDQTFSRKLGSINVKEAMLMVDAWILIAIPENRICAQNILDAFLTHMDKMADHQIIYTCYFLGHMKKILDFNRMDALQEYLSPIVEKLSIDELAIVSLGLYSCQIEVSNEHIRNVMLDRFASEFVTMNETSARYISRFIRYFSKKHNLTELADFQKKIIPELHRLSPLGVVNILTLGTLHTSFNETLIKESIKILKPVMKEFHQKSLERILKSITKFKYEDDELFRMIIERLTMKIADRNLFPINFIRCTYHLILRGPVPSNFIKFSLAPQNVEKVLSLDSGSMPHRIGWIDATAEIEIPDYDGPRLSAEDRQKCAMWRSAFKDFHVSATSRFPKEVKNTLDKIYGESYITLRFLMPHFQRKFLVMGFDRGFNPIHAPEEWINRDENTFIHPPDDKNYWVVPQFIYFEQESTSRRIWTFQLVVARFLTKLGYCVFPMNESSWRGILTRREREAYLRICIANRLRQATEDMENDFDCKNIEI